MIEQRLCIPGFDKVQLYQLKDCEDFFIARNDCVFSMECSIFPAEKKFLTLEIKFCNDDKNLLILS